ncbi:MAG TPA: hypothetical protein VF682_26090 [Pseudomonas sp.]|jgi:hypothetical protein
MKTDSTLRLGRIQYRQLAELAKQSGCTLSLGTPEELEGNWGMYFGFGQAVHLDASTSETSLQERIVLHVARDIDAGKLRSSQRPEIDWSQLEDDEIHKFVVCHEIGHFVDNHLCFDIFNVPDSDTQSRCHQVIRGVNEILADRFAWNMIRPGEPVPLCETGKRLQEGMAEAMALLDKHVPRVRRAARSLPVGQYAYVPSSMLMSDANLAYVGPQVSAALVDRVRGGNRVHRRDTRSRAFA